MSLLERTAKYFFLIQTARRIKNRAEQLGMDKVKALVREGHSITDIYISGCSPPEKAKLKQDAATLVQMGITPEMLFAELTRQMPEITSIIEGRGDYIKNEMQKIEAFLKQE